MFSRFAVCFIPPFNKIYFPMFNAHLQNRCERFFGKFLFEQILRSGSLIGISDIRPDDAVYLTINLLCDQRFANITVKGGEKVVGYFDKDLGSIDSSRLHSVPSYDHYAVEFALAQVLNSVGNIRYKTSHSST